jgi:hypothetical protein
MLDAKDTTFFHSFFAFLDVCCLAAWEMSDGIKLITKENVLGSILSISISIVRLSITNLIKLRAQIVLTVHSEVKHCRAR